MTFTRPATSAAAFSVKLVFCLALGLMAGWGVQAVRQGIVLPEWASLTGATPAVPTIREAAPFRPPVAADSVTVHLDAEVRVDGATHSVNEGRIALPSGTRFQLSVSGDRSGTLELHAINPNGQTAAAPIWSGPLRVGHRLHTPALKLQGTQGLETLRLVLRTEGDGVLLAERQIQIWHL